MFQFFNQVECHIGMTDNDGCKLISAKSVYGTISFKGLLKALTQARKQLISGFMSKFIIGNLKEIKVEHI